jgi:hypothetical protein
VFDAKADVAKNRLYITLKGFLTDEEAKNAADLVIAEIRRLRPGFDVITDVSEFKATSPVGTQDIARGQKAAVDGGARRFVRVVSQEILGVHQFQRVAKTTGVTAEVAGSVAEAERLLES